MNQKVDQAYFLGLAKKHIEEKKWIDAANVIQKFNFFLQFDIQTHKNLVLGLVEA